MIKLMLSSLKKAIIIFKKKKTFTFPAPSPIPSVCSRSHVGRGGTRLEKPYLTWRCGLASTLWRLRSGTWGWGSPTKEEDQPVSKADVHTIDRRGRGHAETRGRSVTAPCEGEPTPLWVGSPLQGVDQVLFPSPLWSSRTQWTTFINNTGSLD